MQSGRWIQNFQKMYGLDLLSAVLVSFGLFSFAHGQVVNIESKRIYEDSVGWTGSITGLFSAQKNKDMLLSTNFRPNAQYKTKKQNVLFIGDFVFSKGKERVFSNAGMLHFRYVQRIKKSAWKWEGYSQIQYNELLDQRYRFLTGGGIRVKFFDKKHWKFFWGTSSFYEQEQYVSSNQIVEDVRMSNYLSWFIDPKTFFSFSGSTYFQPLWTNFGDYRISGQYVLSFDITKQFSVKMNLTFFHDSEPQTNVPQTVYATTFGVGYKFD